MSCMLRLPKFIAIMLTLSVQLSFAESHDLAQRVKAAYIYNFAKFIEWPQGDVDQRVDICVFYDAEFENLLRKTFSGKQVAGKPVAVHAAERIPPTISCNILFIGQAVLHPDVKRGMQRMLDMPVLTIGEADGFTQDGGIIRFLQVAGKLRFEIDHGSAQESGLKISSKLLRVAQVIPAKNS